MPYILSLLRRFFDTTNNLPLAEETNLLEIQYSILCHIASDDLSVRYIY